MLSGQELVKKYQLRQDLGHHKNVDKRNHLGFFKEIIKEWLTARVTNGGWEAMIFLAGKVTKKTGIPIIFHEQFATAKSYCDTFNETFVNETHISHIEVLQLIEDKQKELRAAQCQSSFALHIYTQIKHMYTKNNLFLSMAIKNKTLLQSEKTVELHCITQAIFMPMKNIHGQIGFSIDPNGEKMQTLSSMTSFCKNTCANSHYIKYREPFQRSDCARQDQQRVGEETSIIQRYHSSQSRFVTFKIIQSARMASGL